MDTDLGPARTEHDCDERGCGRNHHIRAMYHGLTDAQAALVRRSVDRANGSPFVPIGVRYPDQDRLLVILAHYLDATAWVDDPTRHGAEPAQEIAERGAERDLCRRLIAAIADPTTDPVAQVVAAARDFDRADVDTARAAEQHGTAARLARLIDATERADDRP